ncbi:MAG: type IV pilus modification PilV family protein [Minisyncoccia bacterium]
MKGDKNYIFIPVSRLALKEGFSIIEAVVASAILAVGIAGIVGVFAAYERAAGDAVSSTQAMLLAEEGLEATLIERDSSWSTTLGSYSLGTPYFLVWNAGANTWNMTTAGSEVDNTYYRTVTFSSVYRDANDEITTSGGTLDPKTLLATVVVAWLKNGSTSTVSESEYVNDLFGN